MIRKVGAGFICVLLFGCAGGDAPSGGSLSIAVDTVGATEYVRVQGEPPVWRLEPVVTIGSLDEGPAAFGRVSSIMADADGNIYVADGQAAEIRVFDQSGAHVRTIGRRGAGPAEFRSLYAMAWLSDTIAVLDPGNARIELLLRDGTPAGTFRHQPLTGANLYLHRASDREFYARAVAPGAERGRMSSVFVRYSAAGAADTIPEPPPAAGSNQSAIVCHSEEMISAFAVPFQSRREHTFLSGSRRVGGETGEYRIAITGAAGDTLRVIERERAPVSVSDSAWNAGLVDYRTFRERNAGARCEPSGPTRPASKPAWTSLFVDHDGRLWVRATLPDGEVFELFDADGRLVGSVPVPPDMRGTLPYFRDGKLYVVEADELDVQRVAVYRVVER
jgi:hypothetical protein